MRIAVVFMGWACMAMVACSGPPPELPPLMVPADLLPEDEPVFMHAHLDKFKLAVRDNVDRKYDDKYQVEFEYSRLTMHIDRWHEQVGHPKRWGDGKMQRAQYARVPAAQHYRGARKRAVAMGLLAISVLRHNPGQGRPSAGDMKKCEHLFSSRGCPLDGRTLALEHMIRMGMGADRELFLAQLRKARELEERQHAP